jgi:multidrug resistance efflux pump
LDTEKLRTEIARKRRAIAGGEEELEKSTRLAELQQMQANAALAKLDAEIAQALEEVKNNKDRHTGDRRLAEGELHDASIELDSLRRLAGAGAVSQVEVQKAAAKQRELQLKLQQARIPIEEGKVAVLRKARKLAEEDASIRQQEVKIKRSLKMAEIEAGRLEVASLELDLQQAELRAPLTGVVTSSELKVGDIVEPGHPAVEIAEHGGFRLDMFVSSEEIANVKLGMAVKIKLEAFDFERYGTLDGTLDFISPDSTVIEGRPGAVYLVRVLVNGDTIGRGDWVGKVKLGMAGQAEIVTGEESVLKLLVKKIRQSISLK